MPASPRATVIGLGAAGLITAAVILVPAFVLTGYFGSVSQRDSVIDGTRAAIRSLKTYGLDQGGILAPKPIPLDAGIRLLPVTGELSAFADLDIPLHRQPGSLIVYVGAADPDRTTLSATDCTEKLQTLGELVGTSRDLGLPVGFADGTVWLLQQSTPVPELALFLRRDTMALNDRNERLLPFALRANE